MGNSKKLSVELKERSYEIIVGKDLIKTAGQKIEKTISGKDIIIISDKNVAKYYLTGLRKSCENAKLSCREIILPPGENAKTFKQLNLLVERLLSMGISRTTTLIALGGGVVGDITGFAASILLRGINFVQVPTTLLAQVDSSVGGKTGINSSQGKNLIGAFYQPKLVIADVSTLDTLPKRQILAGYSEIVKYGLINNLTFFKWLEKKGAEVCSGRKESQIKAIVESCIMKSGFVSKDELENSKRKLYAGGIGYFTSNQDFDTCIALRTALIKNKKIYVQSGAGIVADSNPKNDYVETVNKQNALLKAIN